MITTMKKTILCLTLTAVICSCNANKKQAAAEVVEDVTSEAVETVQEKAPEAPDFTLQDINGQPLTLSSLRGKYVILDFWGSWCGWCIKGMPKMKEYYQKYAGKFEILGIDCNDSEEKWKDAVAKYELPWLHVYHSTDSHVIDQYEIQGFPTKIIIDPEGKVVNTIIGEDPNFYTLLDKLFSE